MFYLINVEQARQTLPKLLKKVRGTRDCYVITRYGKPIAELTAISDSRGRLAIRTIKDQERFVRRSLSRHSQ